MIIKGSMGYDIHGRKRKQVGKRSKKAKPNFAKQTKKQFKKNKRNLRQCSDWRIYCACR